MVWCERGDSNPHGFYPPDPKLSRLGGVTLSAVEGGSRQAKSRAQPRDRDDGVGRKGGLEPPRFYPPHPKSGASANSATFASKTTIHHSKPLRPDFSGDLHG